MTLRRTAAHVLAAATVLAACSTDNSSVETSDATGATTNPTQESLMVIAGEPLPDTRCEANRAAGTITYLTGFDFAAAASIVEVIVAEAAGYYDDLCLDVAIRSSFSTANYPLIADDTAQFASGGSFSEVVSFALANDADFVVTAVEGRTPIDTLIVKPGAAVELAGLAGTTIGVKGKLPSSVEAMLLSAGLADGTDFSTVLLDGFDARQHIEIPSIIGFPGYKSNEPGALNRAGVGFQTFDPADFGVPGSFGVIYTNSVFAAEHPTAAEDFMRATMRGLADAIADPRAAAATAVERVDTGGNPNFLSLEGETFRWETDAELILLTTPEGIGFGLPDAVLLQAELDAYGALGLFGDAATPEAGRVLGLELMASVYDDDGLVVWPG